MDEFFQRLHQWIQSPFAQDLNLLLSLLGFGITVKVLLEVRDIKKSFLRKARLPEILEELAKLSKNLSANLDNLPTERNKVREQIRRAGILLETAGSKLTKKSEKAKILTIVSKIEESAKAFSTPKESDTDSFWNLYHDIQDAITLIQQILKDTTWE